MSVQCSVFQQLPLAVSRGRGSLYIRVWKVGGLWRNEFAILYGYLNWQSIAIDMVILWRHRLPTIRVRILGVIDGMIFKIFFLKITRFHCSNTIFLRNFACFLHIKLLKFSCNTWIALSGEHVPNCLTGGGCSKFRQLGGHQGSDLHNWLFVLSGNRTYQLVFTASKIIVSSKSYGRSKLGLRLYL